MMRPFQQSSEALRDELIARRRDFHQHPELGFEEFRTAGIVAGELNALGLEVQTGVGKTGVVAILEGAHDGPTVLIRADMDALPINEENASEYVSQSSGKMHACGHDGHTAIALGVAKLLSVQRDHIAGRVKFVFQPAEEIAGGAQAMIADGVLDSPRPDVSIGLHLWNSLPPGTLGVATGPVMAGASIFDITITGKGGHGAAPHTTADPVVCAAHIITAAQSILARNVDPLETGVISITRITAGEAYNVIPQTATLRGTLRAFKAEVRDLMVARLQSIVENIAAAMGCTGEISYKHQTQPVTNDADVSQRLRDLFTPIVGADALDTTVRTMGAEDVGEFMTDVPGMYFFLGAADATQTAYYGHHHPRFTFDENVLPLGVELLASAAASYLIREE